MNDLDVVYTTRLMRQSEAFLCQRLGHEVYGPDFAITGDDYLAYASRVHSVLPVVAINNDTKMPIGVLVMLITRPAIICTELHVHPNFHRYGIGSRLLEYMESYAGRRKCIISFNDAIDGYEERRQAFLDHHGYRLRSIIHDSDTGKRAFNYGKG